MKTILLTGATGYVGGRLLRALETSPHLRVRCLARRPGSVPRGTTGRVDVVAGDVLTRDSLDGPMRGVDTAYYLVHSMGATADFEASDRVAATHFADAARQAGVRRIIYLGGLGEDEGPGGSALSAHLRSRQEVGAILRASGVPVVEFRASIVIGSGSLSFEMIRALVERLPVMITPRWVGTKAQPIGIVDLIAYLVAALELETSDSRVFEVGGTDQVSYGDIMNEYARQRGLRRLMIAIPVLTPRLSSLWLGLVTPLYARVGRKLVESLRHSTVVTDDSALRAFAIRPVGYREAIALALRNEDQEFAETRWSDALSSAGEPGDWGGVRFGGRLVDSRIAHSTAAPAAAFAPIRRIGGTAGWYHANFLWRIRAWIDILVGGVGLRRGRRDPDDLRVGDALDFWRVETFEPDHLLRLSAEMKLPGRAWLVFEVTGNGSGSTVRQTAIFDPEGLAGLAYWYALYPLHYVIFRGMLRAIVRSGVG